MQMWLGNRIEADLNFEFSDDHQDASTADVGKSASTYMRDLQTYFGPCVVVWLGARQGLSETTRRASSSPHRNTNNPHSLH